MILVTIHDTKADLHYKPNTARTPGDFVRSVQMEAKNPDSMIHKYPADYDLVVLGSWDEATGTITPDRKRLGSVLDLCPLS